MTKYVGTIKETLTESSYRGFLLATTFDSITRDGNTFHLKLLDGECKLNVEDGYTETPGKWRYEFALSGKHQIIEIWGRTE